MNLKRSIYLDYSQKFFKRWNVLICKNNLASYPLGKRDIVKDFQLRHVIVFKLPAEKSTKYSYILAGTRGSRTLMTSIPRDVSNGNKRRYQ